MESNAGQEVVVEAADPAKVRRAVWMVLLALGALQAWASRHTTSPDGVSYMDLSDAVVRGNLGELLNAYWSPLYPALIGILRLVLRPTPYWENAVQHLLNLLTFAGSIAAFDYFLRALKDASAAWGRGELKSTWGAVAAYAVFGAFSLIMTPLTLPTPDLLVSAATFLVFGALLRLTHASEWRRPAVMLGLALAMGSLAKSFVIPWAAICLLVAFAATRQKLSWRPAATSAAVWLVVIAPWCIALSMSAGRLTFGDSGRLTYIWYVNQVESPSDKLMPHAAATPATDSVLRGVAITPNATGTNPIWYDPARWYSDLSPKFEAGKQARVFAFLVGQYVSSLAPVFLFLWFSFAVANGPARKLWWQRTWVVIVPSIAAIGAYSLILVTTRYVAPFYIALILVVWAGLEWPSRIVPRRLLIAVGVPLVIMLVAPRTNNVVSAENAVLAGVLAAWMGRRWGTAGMIVCGILGGAVMKVLQPGSERQFVMAGAVVIVSGYWLAGTRAIANFEGRRLSAVMRAGLIATSAFVIGVVGFLKFRSSITQPGSGQADPNAIWVAVQHLRIAGVQPGEPFAVVGSPFEAYWVRMAQSRIVAVVPPPSMQGYLQLRIDQRAVLEREFVRAGATRLVVQTANAPFAGDTSWKPVQMIGWVKTLRSPSPPSP